MQMIGDDSYVTVVKQGSDAEKKGLSPGDQILAINGLTPTRSDLRKIQYLFLALRPQPGLELKVRDVNQKERTIGVAFQIRETRRIVDVSRGDYWDEIREAEKGSSLHKRRSLVVGDTIIWKFPSFAVDEKATDVMVGDSMKYKSMVIDLRGNSGGSVETLLHLVRHFFDHDVKIADVQKRSKAEPAIAKSHGPVFSGKIIVLIDSGSASASEVFAKVMQLEKRGMVVGDQSAGAVMEAEIFPHHFGRDRVIHFATEITRANLVMSDGKSLENVGVSPDIKLLPTAADLQSNRDPVLAHALALLGEKVSAEEAGRFFPAQWRDE
jgi:carboxyl-terminal processing protease